MSNPFAINFGIIPSQYIERNIIIEEVVSQLNSSPVQNPCFMITGVRGSGKTVTMTAIERQLATSDKWIVIDLNSEREMLQSLVAKLYDSNEYMSSFLSKSINLSKFGIGLAIENKPPVADIESALEIILKEIKKQGKRLLVTIDEVSNTLYMRQFASSFQLLIRQDLPIFLIMAGLYENIHNLENENNLTFLYRTPKIEMEPLNITLIKHTYMNLFNVDSDTAMNMSIITKGYPFAYQVLGKYIWESANKNVDEITLAKFDEAMAKYVYNKIWSELSPNDKWYLSFITQKDSMNVSELLEMTGKKKNEFSQYRARLRDKGIIDVSNYGLIKITLPRFSEFVKLKIELGE